MIRNKVVSNRQALYVPAHLSVGQYFLDKITQNCERDGNAVAMVNGNTGEKQTYNELLQAIANIGAGLKELGVKRGNVVGFCSESRNELIAAYIGAICCGATITMYNTLYTQDELKHVINISKPTIIMCSEAALKHIDVFKSVESIKNIIQINGDLTKGAISLKVVLKAVDPRDYEAKPVDGVNDTAMILYSSGTTGLPKGVMITHLGLLLCWEDFESGYFVDVSERIITALPWYHCYGWISTMHCFLANKLCVYLNRFIPDKYLSLIQEHKIIGTFTVPPIIVFFAKSDLVDKYDVSSLKCFWCGAAPLRLQIIKELTTRLPNVKLVLQGYGMTETTLAVLKQKDECGSEPGLLPVPGTKIKVVDTVTGEKLGPNENGEICVKAPHLMKGYKDNEAATKASFDDEGYLKTGDIGFYDEKGSFSIVDRLKEIIKYKGYQVAPAAVESVILQHAGVAECGVVGAPDERAGELPTAFVVLKHGFTLTEDELLDFTNDKLSPLARLRGGVIFVDEIPKNPAGKILRRVLRDTLLAMNSR